ncbi:hypothetical protein [Caminibacter pacificus]|jgi:GTP1/Obg family GTP-binding protein
MNEKIYKIDRTAQNIDIALGFLAEKTDRLNDLLKVFSEKCELKDEVIALDEVTGGISEVYELLNNLSEELKEQIKEAEKGEL